MVFPMIIPSLPYLQVGKIHQLWEKPDGAMVVRVKWFYHPEEIMTSKKFALKHQVSFVASFKKNRVFWLTFVRHFIRLF